MRNAGIAAAVIAGAAVWLLAHGIGGAARAMLVLVMAGLPPLAIAQAHEVESLPEDAPRVSLYLATIVSLWLLAALALAAALATGFTTADLGLQPPDRSGTLWTIGATAAGLLIVAIFRVFGRERAIVKWLVPRTLREKLVFLGLSVTAGVTEEVVFRGFLIVTLNVVIGSMWGALFVASAVFGLLHAYQGIAGATRAAVLGVALSVPFILSGSLLPSIIAHAALDALAGTVLARWLTEERRGQSV